MNRKLFLKLMATLPLITKAMNSNALNNLLPILTNTPKMPVLFLGHGSPMNAIEENEFVASWRKLGNTIPKPNAILCISAHWETNGTFVTAMPKPQTIHDFGGFPQALFDVQYPAPGSPELALETKQLIKKTDVGLDQKWGLDHGAWSVIKPMFPNATIPVIQMSIDYSKNAQYHYELAQELKSLRNKGVLIIGSGNMVHNLGMVAWNKLQEPEYGYDWAIEANEKMKKMILSNNHQQLINFKSNGRAFDLSIPSPEHYLPLIYTLGLKTENDNTSIFNDKVIGGSLTMTSVKFH